MGRGGGDSGGRWAKAPHACEVQPSTFNARLYEGDDDGER